MRDDDDDIDFNTILIPHEMEDRSRLFGDKKSPLSSGAYKNDPTKRFEVMTSTTSFRSLQENMQEAGYGGASSRNQNLLVEGKTSKDFDNNQAAKKKGKGLLNVSTQGDSLKNQQTNKWQESGKRPAATNMAIEGKSEKTVSGEDYQKKYLQQEKEKKEFYDQKRATQQKEERASANARQEDMTKRAEATQIQDQLDFWRQQYDQGQYDKGTVDGMVSSLESQLGTISPDYWRK